MSRVSAVPAAISEFIEAGITKRLNDYTNTPKNDLSKRKFRQRFNRKNMDYIWTNINTVSKDEKARVKALYDRKDKNKLEWCETEFLYELTKGAGKLGYGRYYGQKGSLESIERSIRGTLCGQYYYDIDVVNCHPTLIPQIAKKWYNYDMPEMQKYVNNRAEYFKMMNDTLGWTDEECKSVILVIMYGGNIDEDIKLPDGFEIKVPAQLLKIQQEMKNLTELFKRDSTFSELFDLIKKNKKPNEGGKLTAFIIQTEERKCLESMVSFLDSKNVRVDVLAYDGVQVLNNNEITNELLNEMCEYVKSDTEYDIKLKIKEFETIELDDNDETPIDEDVIINDLYACKHFVKLLGNDIQCQDGIIYFYDRLTGLWNHGKEAAFITVQKHADAMVFKQINKQGNQTIIDYGGNTKNINAMLTHLNKSQVSNITDKIQPSASIGCLLFLNGWFDINTLTFYEGFEMCRDKYFSKRINRNFVNERNEILESQIIKTLFRNPYNNPEVGDYYANCISRAIAGCINDKIFHSIVGRSNCGKGVMTLALKATFDEYVEDFNLNCLKYNPRNGTDEAKQLSWYAPLIGARIAIGNEARIDNKPLDGNLIKTLSSGGDRLIIRQNFVDDYRVNPTATFFAFCNDLPPIAPCDEPVKNRMSSIPHTKTFINKPQQECTSFEMESDEKLKDKIQTQEWKNSFFWVIMDAYKNGIRLPKPCEVKDEINELFVVEDIKLKQVLEERYEFTDEPESYIASRDIITYIKSQGIAYTETKIGRELRALGLKKTDKKVAGKTIVVYYGLKE